MTVCTRLDLCLKIREQTFQYFLKFSVNLTNWFNPWVSDKFSDKQCMSCANSSQPPVQPVHLNSTRIELLKKIMFRLSIELVSTPSARYHFLSRKGLCIPCGARDEPNALTLQSLFRMSDPSGRVYIRCCECSLSAHTTRAFGIHLNIKGSDNHQCSHGSRGGCTFVFGSASLFSGLPLR